ncbi:MAG: hypothetical protein PQ964_07325 [Methanobacteriaceae archaeon]|jgi:hypothetical protein
MNGSTILVTLLLFTVVISLFAVSAVNITTDSANITNNTDLINQTRSDAPIQPMSNTIDLINQTGSNASINAPIQPMSLAVILTVTPTSLDLGTVDPDGVERTFTGATTVRVQALAFGRSSGNLMSGHPVIL